MIPWYFQDWCAYFIAKSVPAGSSGSPPPKVPIASGRKCIAPQGRRRPRSWSSSSPQRSASRTASALSHRETERGIGRDLLEPVEDRARAVHRLVAHHQAGNGGLAFAVALGHLLHVRPRLEVHALVVEALEPQRRLGGHARVRGREGVEGELGLGGHGAQLRRPCVGRAAVPLLLVLGEDRVDALARLVEQVACASRLVLGARACPPAGWPPAGRRTPRAAGSRPGRPRRSLPPTAARPCGTRPARGPRR